MRSRSLDSISLLRRPLLSWKFLVYFFGNSRRLNATEPHDGRNFTFILNLSMIN